MNEKEIETREAFEQFTQTLSPEQLALFRDVLNARAFDGFILKSLMDYAFGYVTGWMGKQEQRVRDAEGWSYHPDDKSDEYGDDVKAIDFVSKLPLSVLEQIPPLLSEIKDIPEFAFNLSRYSRRRLESITKVTD